MKLAIIDNFRKNLAVAIEAGGYKKVEVARAAGTSRSHLDCVLYGPTDPTLTMCDRFANAVGVPLIALLSSPETFSDCVLTNVRK